MINVSLIRLRTQFIDFLQHFLCPCFPPLSQAVLQLVERNANTIQPHRRLQCLRLLNQTGFDFSRFRFAEDADRTCSGQSPAEALQLLVQMLGMAQFGILEFSPQMWRCGITLALKLGEQLAGSKKIALVQPGPEDALRVQWLLRVTLDITNELTKCA
jgi:hypothetical protein